MKVMLELTEGRLGMVLNTMAWLEKVSIEDSDAVESMVRTGVGSLNTYTVGWVLGARSVEVVREEVMCEAKLDLTVWLVTGASRVWIGV